MTDSKTNNKMTDDKITQTSRYADTRQAWRDIWLDTTFDKELKSLEYAHHQEIMRSYLPYVDKEQLVLEAGCGVGQVVYYLRERGYSIIGLDYAPEALVSTHQRFPQLPLHMGDVHFLPYAENTFGTVLSFGVVEHFEQGPDVALQESYRVLRKGGKLVITVPHPQFVDSLYELKQKLRPNKTLRADYYERTYTHQELADHIKAAGFNIDLVQPSGHSYTFYGLGGPFRRPNEYYTPSNLAEFAGSIGRSVLPWLTAFHTLIIATKTT